MWVSPITVTSLTFALLASMSPVSGQACNTINNAATPNDFSLATSCSTVTIRLSNIVGDVLPTASSNSMNVKFFGLVNVTDTLTISGSAQVEHTNSSGGKHYPTVIQFFFPDLESVGSIKINNVGGAGGTGYRLTVFAPKLKNVDGNFEVRTNRVQTELCRINSLVFGGQSTSPAPQTLTIGGDLTVVSQGNDRVEASDPCHIGRLDFNYSQSVIVRGNVLMSTIEGGSLNRFQVDVNESTFRVDGDLTLTTFDAALQRVYLTSMLDVGGNVELSNNGGTMLDIVFGPLTLGGNVTVNQPVTNETASSIRSLAFVSLPTSASPSAAFIEMDPIPGAIGSLMIDNDPTYSTFLDGCFDLVISPAGQRLSCTTAAPTLAPTDTPTFSPTSMPTVTPTSSPTPPTHAPTQPPSTTVPPITVLVANAESSASGGGDDSTIIIVAAVVSALLVCCLLGFCYWKRRQAAKLKGDLVGESFMVNPAFGTIAPKKKKGGTMSSTKTGSSASYSDRPPAAHDAPYLMPDRSNPAGTALNNKMKAKVGTSPKVPTMYDKMKLANQAVASNETLRKGSDESVEEQLYNLGNAEPEVPTIALANITNSSSTTTPPSSGGGIYKKTSRRPKKGQASQAKPEFEGFNPTFGSGGEETAERASSGGYLHVGSEEEEQGMYDGRTLPGFKAQSDLIDHE